MNRRTFLQTASASLAFLASAQPPQTKIGVASTSYLSFWKPKDAYEFLEHCHSLGAAGIQASLNGDLPKLRAKAEQLGMYIEAMVSLPKTGDTSEFERKLQDAKAVNALALRAGLLSGRRYETFASPEDWQSFVAQCHRSIEAAAPLVEKYKIPLGIENHKDWTVDDMVGLMKKYSSENIGVCLDFGNNLALLDDPMDAIRRLAPYAVSTHVKDVGVESYPDGFLMSEVIFGTGFFDLSKMISILQEHRPATRLSLEMITRDPLPIPCMTAKYWRTFPARDESRLTRTLEMVKKNARGPLPRVSNLAPDAQRQAEEQNVQTCLNLSKGKWA